MQRTKNKKLIRGVGISDVSPVRFKVLPEERLPNGNFKYKTCLYYRKWENMLKRCYSVREHKEHPTYKDCTVCDEWLLFSNFKSWMEKQDWEGKHLDKDILVEGNKVYSPETCVFVHNKVNTFLLTCSSRRGDWLLGVYWAEDRDKYGSGCSNPFSKKRKYLGYFTIELEAHLAWKKQKHIYSCELADSEYVTDERVKQVLLHRYENYTVVEDHIK